MDLVTVVAACAIGLRSELFVPLGVQGDCARAASAGMQAIANSAHASIDRWAPEIAAASRRFAVPDALLHAVMRAESDGVPTATSPAGAMGLMQLMPRTWAMMRLRYRLGDDPYAPADNIMAGAAFLRELIDRYGAPDFLFAYNAGSAHLEAQRALGASLPDETQRYVARLGPVARAVLAASSASAGLMDAENLRSSGQPPDSATSDLLSVVTPAVDLRRGMASFQVNPDSGRAHMGGAISPIRRLIVEPTATQGEGIFVHLGNSRG